MKTLKELNTIDRNKILEQVETVLATPDTGAAIGAAIKDLKGEESKKGDRSIFKMKKVIPKINMSLVMPMVC